MKPLPQSSVDPAVAARLARCELAKRRFRDFCGLVDIPGALIDEDVDEDGVAYRAIHQPQAAHHLLLIEKLEAVERGDIRRLMVFMPPGSAKSTYASVLFPTWFMGRDKGRNVILGTYASDLARKIGRRARSIIKQPAYREIFGTSLSSDSSAADEWALDNGNEFMGGGILSGITGNRADLLLVDDPIKGRQDADSDTIRARTKGEFEDSLKTRLKPGGRIVLIQTRWHGDDLAGSILPENYAGESGAILCRDGEIWEVLCIPAEANRADDPLGRKIGEMLWPEWFDESHWRQYRANARTWSALYQQQPSAAEGVILKRANWQYFKPTEVVPGALIESLGITRIVQGWDTAFKKGTTNDYSVGVTLGIAKTRYYLLEVWRDRAEFPDLKAAVVAQASKWGSHAVVIEDKASGQSLIQELRRNTRIPLIPVQADNDKVTRTTAVSPIQASGLVFMPEGEGWISDFVGECAAFPNAAHDDQVDAFVHALTYARPMATFKEPEEEDDWEARMLRQAGSNLSWMG